MLLKLEEERARFVSSCEFSRSLYFISIRFVFLFAWWQIWASRKRKRENQSILESFIRISSKISDKLFYFYYIKISKKENWKSLKMENSHASLINIPKNVANDIKTPSNFYPKEPQCVDAFRLKRATCVLTPLQTSYSYSRIIKKKKKKKKNTNFIELSTGTTRGKPIKAHICS